jgi:hypothetical protein
LADKGGYVELWQSLLVAFGGNAALLLVLGFFGRSLMTSVLARDIEQFKASLQVAAVEHEVRFSKLHDKRAEVLADLYRLLVAATWQTTTFSSPMQWVGDPDKKTQYVTAMNAISEYFRFFDQHRIWLPSTLCAPLENFAKTLRTPTITLGVYLQIDEPNTNTAKERTDAWTTAWDSVQNDVPKLRIAIEAEFRSLLGAGESKAG